MGSAVTFYRQDGSHSPLLLALVSLFSLYGPANGGCGWCDRCVDKFYREGIFPLFDAVNSYRRANGLSNLKCDEILTEVAYIHTLDQEAVNPWKSSECPANGHNWLSRVGEEDGRNMKPCCYEKDGADCMWKKPNELYSWYKGYGFEISAGVYDSASPEAAAEGAPNSWKGSKGHNDVILAKGDTWKKMTRIGCFRKGKFANCWFSSGYQG